ncbi:MAG: sulfatase, partial [Verrucomicrobia bacterium]|nr:sulfatase [Verrucomicrobiota bacterium]
VHFVDFAPTVLSLAGVKIPGYMQGRAFAGKAKVAPGEFVLCTRDRMDERYDMMRSIMDKRWLYIRNFRPDLPYVQPLEYMFRARGYQSWARIAREGKLTPATAMFWGEKPTEELYDCDTDPDNVKNLATDSAHRKTLERFRAELKRRVLAYKDNGFLPEGSQLEGYDASRKEGAWPVERVFEMAVLASERNPKNLSKLIEALNDPSEPMRWWGAQGCTMIGKKAAPAEEALRRRLEDWSGSVQVAAAEAMARIGKVDAALPVLERCLKSGGPVSVQAGNVFYRLGEAARPSLPAVKAVLKPGDERNQPGNPKRILEYVVAVLEGREQPLVYPRP